MITKTSSRELDPYGQRKFVVQEDTTIPLFTEIEGSVGKSKTFTKGSTYVGTPVHMEIYEHHDGVFVPKGAMTGMGAGS